jgi:hypothetical protein
MGQKAFEAGEREFAAREASHFETLRAALESLQGGSVCAACVLLPSGVIAARVRHCRLHPSPTSLIGLFCAASAADDSFILAPAAVKFSVARAPSQLLRGPKGQFCVV